MRGFKLDSKPKIVASLTVTALMVLYSRPLLTTYLACQLLDAPSLENLQRAQRLEPDNAESFQALGRYYQIRDGNYPKAIEQYEQAIQRNPFNPWYWYHLAEAYAESDRLAAAEKSIQIAQKLNPNSYNLAWSIANFWLKLGRAAQALDSLKLALWNSSDDAEMQVAIFETCWEIEKNHAVILERVIPAEPETLVNYLRFLTDRKDLEATRPVWLTLFKLAQPIKLGDALQYIDFLIDQRAPEEAYQVWRQALTLCGHEALPASPTNLVYNESFEAEPLHGGFDWRISEVQGARWQIDRRIRRSGKQSLLIAFNGTENLVYRHLYQLVPVKPNTRYYFKAGLRSEGITTDQRPQFEICDYYAQDDLRERTIPVIGSQDWFEQSMEFVTGPHTKLIAIYLQRSASKKFDTDIKGKLWIDDVVLRLFSPGGA